MTQLPTPNDVLAAADRIRPRVPVSPLFLSPGLSELLAAEVWIKADCVSVLSAFKLRGALNHLLAAPPADAAVTSSTGNHGQGVAYAGRLLGVPVAICVPEKNNPEKNAAMRALGAELVEVGANYDETVVACSRIAAERGMTLVHSTNNPNVIAGAGTMTLEILEQQPDIDAIVDE